MSVAALIDIMSEMTNIHEMLLPLAEQKKEALIHNRIEIVNQIVHKEMQFVRQLNELDQQRMSQVNEILISRGFRPNPQVTVSDLLKVIFKAEDKLSLQNAQQTLLQRISRLKAVNEQNQKLIEQSLAYINYSYDLLLGPPEDDTIYRKPTHSNKGGARSGLFDTRA